MPTPDGVPVALAADADLNGPREPFRLRIRVSQGSGVGSTRLAAFDTALHSAGVAGYNIVRLSSVIPPHAEVTEVPGTQQIKGVVGDLAFCVYAAAYASTPGEQAWAGVAWALHDESGAGVFVEHTASSEGMVRHDLHATIDTMAKTRGRHFRPAGTTVASAVCVDHPVCAIVIATYGTKGWSQLLNSEG